jgi:hypothetical protein
VRLGNVLPRDFVTPRDQRILTQIAALDESAMGIEGVLPQPVGQVVGVKDADKGALSQVMSNPLEVPIDVAFRMAGTRNLVTQAARDSANPYTDNYDSPWELFVPYGTVHLDAGETKKYRMALYCDPQGQEVAPPQVEFVVSYLDAKGRTVPTVLKRRVPLVPELTVPVIGGALTAASWDEAVRGGTYSWVANANDKAQPAPDFEMLADAQNLYLKVQVGGKAQPNYFGRFERPDDLPCDAISVAWAANAFAWNSWAQRVVVVWPTPEKAEVWTNSGVGGKQTPLTKNNDTGVQATLTKQDNGYQVLLTLPRSLVIDKGSCVMNVTVTNNDGGAISTSRSWAREDLGPKVWGRVRIQTPTTHPPETSK